MKRKTIEQSAVSLAIDTLHEVKPNFLSGYWGIADCSRLYDCYVVAVRKRHVYPTIVDGVRECIRAAKITDFHVEVDIEVEAIEWLKFLKKNCGCAS